MKKFKILTTILQHPKQILSLGYQTYIRNKNTINYKNNIKSKFNITQLPTIDLLDIIPDLHDKTKYYSYLSGTSLVTDILLLKGLAKKFNDCNYLEIGSYRGESIATVAEVAKQCVSITLSEKEMREFGMDENHIKCHDFFSKGIPNIKSYLHNSLTFDYKQLDSKFDLIFVDGDHSYSAVVQDTKNVFNLLKNENSIIVWHDYGFTPEEVRHEVFAAILEGTPEKYHKNLYHVSNTMCAIFIRGEFKTYFTEFVTLPNKKFTVEVTATKA